MSARRLPGMVPRVGRQKIHSRIDVKIEPAQGIGKTNFGLERPRVGSQVDQFGFVILSSGCVNRDAACHDHASVWGFCKLRRT